MNVKEDKLNDHVRAFWEQEACGTWPSVVGEATAGSLEWYQRIEEYRYRTEPFIHAIAQFTRHRGKRMLEIGVGAGTDHLQWARAGLDCYGVDLTDAAIATTEKHLAHYGLKSNLRRLDAERLPFEDCFFDLVYSWGVIHHSESPSRIIGEIHRTLKPGGQFVGMMYGRHSAAVFKMWVKLALLRGKPWRSFKDVVWNHVESIGTKAYTAEELRQLLGAFAWVETLPLATALDRSGWPQWMSCFLPDKWGWFIALRAVK